MNSAARVFALVFAVVFGLLSAAGSDLGGLTWRAKLIAAAGIALFAGKITMTVLRLRGSLKD
jgi:Kef-type K+ transport system membrane component KefB